MTFNPAPHARLVSPCSINRLKLLHSNRMNWGIYFAYWVSEVHRREAHSQMVCVYVRMCIELRYIIVLRVMYLGLCCIGSRLCEQLLLCLNLLTCSIIFSDVCIYFCSAQLHTKYKMISYPESIEMLTWWHVNDLIPFILFNRSLVLAGEIIAG